MHSAKVWCGLMVFFMWSEVALGVPCANGVSRLIALQGILEYQRPNQSHWSLAQINQEFCPGDVIRSELHSRATLLMRNGSMLKLDQLSSLVFPELAPEETTLLDLIRGAIHVISNVPYRMKVKTPFVDAGIEGTEFTVRVAEKDTRVWVIEGRVLVRNSLGKIRLRPGQAARAEAGKSPLPYLEIKPRDAVHWALYYPPILDYRVSAATRPAQQQAIVLYRKGQIAAALESLKTISAKDRDHDFYNQRAAILMSVGNVRSARRDIRRTLAKSPDSGVATALESIIELTQNRKEKALSLATKAVALDADSPTPRIALSFAQQAAFDIEGAKKSLRKAVDLSPDDPLAWARLAELELSDGDLDQALKAVRKAEALDPQLAHSQVVLGFAQLVRINIDQAKEAFEKAIERDPSAPLARLGIGLARIREGDVEAGTRDIEEAAILDPENSLIRSYLGKAYFDEKRTYVASREFGRAKVLDPKDPTPWFYDAIQKQTTNRPIEALKDMQKAIDLNDNRAVYRSRLLMDDDLAARSAAIGRIYNDLGFQQRGLVEGWKSVNSDPVNFSAHRLLADNYSSLPRHEIARVSELLQSQLLQPLNITPIQAQLADSRLLLLEGLGPTNSSFNEFNPLFARNRFAIQASGIAGSNETLGDEVTQSGIWNNTSYSIGQLHFETQGYRSNNDFTEDLYNAFVQSNFGRNLSIQAEYRHSDSYRGDRPLRFDPTNFSPNLRIAEKEDFVRLGLRYAASPRTTLLGSFSYRNSISTEFNRNPVNIPIFGAITLNETSNSNTEGLFTELQSIFYSEDFYAVNGVGYFNSDTDTTLSAQFQPPIFMRPSGTKKTVLQHTNLYSYLTLRAIKPFTFTLGISADFLESRSDANSERNQVNPKFGMLWNIGKHTIVRAAAFRSLKRSLLLNQTIEPTQVAGFNQFYDDISGTDAWRYGLALDHKYSSSFYTGFELSLRELSVPISADFAWKEKQARGYVFWSPHPTLALSLNPSYEYLKRRNNAMNGILSLSTLSVPAQFSYFHPSGLTFQSSTAFVDQSGTFSAGNILKGHDQFWITNAGIRYRLPKRYGTLSFQVDNVFDSHFLFHQDTDPTKSSRLLFSPERTFIGRFTIAF